MKFGVFFPAFMCCWLCCNNDVSSQNRRPDYISTFMENLVSWEAASSRLEKAQARDAEREREEERKKEEEWKSRFKS